MKKLNDDKWKKFFLKKGKPTNINSNLSYLDLTTSKWHNYELNNIKFLYLLNNLESYCLTQPIHGNEDNNFQYGFLEKDFMNILWYTKDIHSDINTLLNCTDSAFLSSCTRLVLASYKDVDFSLWKENFQIEDINMVFFTAILLGQYEQYGIEFSKVIKKALKENLLNKEDVIEISIYHGFLQTKRKETPEYIKKQTKINKCKYILNYLV